MERKEKSSEMLSGSDSQEHLPENTKEEGVRMFKANPDFLLRNVAGGSRTGACRRSGDI